MVCECHPLSGFRGRVFSSLNPCFDGIWSASEGIQSQEHETVVLILVLMEYGLRAD